jgi:2,5-diamino-6-(ribosylamino)-4(3H)-pyrimidinone 5'-phosphate reductase
MLEPLPSDIPKFLEKYLPDNGPFITLTYAQSLDSRIAAAPGERTYISHAQTKTMTHYIRAHHDAILVGINTVLADNPSLNCRYGTNNSKIRPVVIDPNFRFFSEDINNYKLIDNYKRNNNLKPIFIISEDISIKDESVLNLIDIIQIPLVDGIMSWSDIFTSLHNLGLKSIMVEGGATIINTLLTTTLVDSLIITIGPIFLGNEGVQVSPSSQVKLENINWWTGIQDSVMCANLKK